MLYSLASFQAEIDIVSAWSDEKQMPLSLDKCGVMQGGSHQPNNDYVIHGNTMYVLDSFKDLGAMRSANSLHDDQCSATALKASKVASAMKHLFQQNTPQLLWPAFTNFLLPVLSYGMQVWSPYLAKDINTIKSVQRRFAKSMRGLNVGSSSRILKQGGGGVWS